MLTKDEWIGNKQRRDDEQVEEDTGCLVNTIDLTIEQAVLKRRRRLQHRVIAFGCVALLFSMLFIIAGILVFVLRPTVLAVSRHSYQAELLWNNVILLMVGLSAVGSQLLHSDLLLSLATLNCLVSAVMAVGSLSTHLAGAYFAHLDAKSLPITINNGTTESESPAYGSGNLFHLNILIVVLGMLSWLTTVILFRDCRQLLCSTAGPCQRRDVVLTSPRLTIASVVQLILGLLLTAWCVSIEVLYAGNNVDLNPIDADMLPLCLLMTSAGCMSVVALADRARSMLFTAALLHGVGLLLAVNFSHRPFALFSFILDHWSATSRHSAFFYESRLFLCLLLTITYALLSALTGYLFFKLIKLSLSSDEVQPADGLSREKKWRRRRFSSSILPFIQTVLGLVYALLDVLAVGMFYMYKLDFTPLPVFVVCSGLLTLRRWNESTVVALAAGVSLFCLPYAFRDVYLFIFHTAWSISPSSVRVVASRMTGTNLAVHMALFLIALLELAISLFLLLSALKTLASKWRLVPNGPGQLAGTILKLLRLLAIFQTFTGSVEVGVGGRLFTSHAKSPKTAALCGDGSIVRGTLIAGAGALLFTAVSRPSLLRCALLVQAAVLVATFAQLDAVANQASMLFQAPTLGKAAFGAMLTALILTTVIVSVLALYLERSKMEPKGREQSALINTGREMKTICSH
ncbi:hypothetical protein T4B_7448 [Trichinella pseudospiralis]|uniref:Uncharacterized protein n=1 Tax=Trichinella pseudospiralis TaxID=6337 RepID=A0A0V1E720_TRIPS|nr:hypothetical protein T4A_1873 [Trichinella pseudospiralis]KRZ28267.1 hypothetical protein T4B_7448 [Trichinella pseudospiralis]KRZ34211.1 hypothetical protein T4C_12992 [Trichinella pseudospiralis]